MNENKRFTYEYDEYNGNLFDNKMNTFYHIEDSDENIEVLCDRLNLLVEENEQLKSEKKDMQILINTISDQRNEFHRGVRENVNRVGKLEKENEQLKHDATVLIQANQDYRRENEQLKQRNNRQAKQLDRLYNLIGEKDWRTLTDILDDFKRCEEQLQKEWGTYGDFE